MKKHLLNFKLMALTFGMCVSATASAQFTVVTSGAWSNAATWGGVAPTSTVLNQNILIPAGYTVTLDADLTYSGLLTDITVNGVLTNTTTNGITITLGALSGNGSISIDRISFTNAGTCSFTGNLDLKHLYNSTPVLAFTAIANISDTLNLESGTLILNTNANLTMLSGSVVKINNGSISMGAGVLNTGNAYSVLYIGSSKTAGIELNSVTLQNVNVNLSSNTQSVSLNANLIVNGNVNNSMGKLALNGKKLTLKGDLILGAGATLHSNALSDINIEGPGNISISMLFDANSSVRDLTINRPNSTTKLYTPLNLAGHLNLLEGSFSIQNSGILTANSLSTIHVEKGNLAVAGGSFVGIATYSVEYMGATNGTSGAELSGSGLGALTINYLSDTNKVILSSDATIGSMLNMMKGKLDLNGKVLSLNGTLSQNANATLIGSTSSVLELNLTAVTNDTLLFNTLNDASQSLSKLKINTSGTTPIVLGSKLIIANELNFVKGKIELTDYDLIVLPVASVVGYSDTRYVVTSGASSGALVMNVVAGSSYVTFPIGVMTDYAPAHVQQTSAGAGGNFSARTATVISMGLKMVNKNWFIESTATTINANLKFGWIAAAEVNGFDRNNAYVSHYTSTWDVVSTGTALSAAHNTYELSRMGLTSLSPFAVVEDGEVLKVNEISKIEEGTLVYPNPANDILNIKLMNPSADYSYEIQDISGRIISTSTMSENNNGVDVSNLQSGYYFVKITNQTEHKITTKRFIKN